MFHSCWIVLAMFRQHVFIVVAYIWDCCSELFVDSVRTVVGIALGWLLDCVGLVFGLVWGSCWDCLIF